MSKTVIGRPRFSKESLPPVRKPPSTQRESADFFFAIGLITAALLLWFPMLEGEHRTADLPEAIPVMSEAVTEFSGDGESKESVDRMKPEKIDDLAEPERRTSLPVSDSFYDRIGALFADLIFGFTE